MLSSDRPPPAWKAYAIVGATLLAPALAGTTELWAMAALMALTGVLFLIAPPRRSLPLFPTLLFASLFLLALTAFLPASLFSYPAWRLDLMKLGADLPSARSPQPWLTLQWCWLLLFVILWSYYLLSFEWTRRLREKALITFAIGVLLLGAVLIGAHVTKLRIPFWPDVPEFGFFPNRNQTSNVFGLAGIIIYAIGLHRLQERRPTWWIWLCSLSLICWALILNFSRAGIILFFGGALIWHAWWFSQAKERRGPAIALCGLALLIGLLLLNGGKTLARFEDQTATGLFSSEENGRIPIFRDALQFSRQSPLLGVGLGNFRPLFSQARNYSVTTSEAVHPESDWIWGAVDLGWLGPILAFLLILWWLGNCFPFPTGTARALRIAAMICGLAFAFHGLVDVSAHRLGTLWPALFLASIALSPHTKFQTSKLAAWSFRASGILLLVVSGWWFASILGKTKLPTSEEITRLKRAAETAVANGDYGPAIDQANAGLALAPLDWLLYYHRGVAEASLFHPRGEALRDFALARYLYPNWPELYLKEGVIWLGVDEADLAFEVWQEGMKRPTVAQQLYNEIYSRVSVDADLRERWRQLGMANKADKLTFLRHATPAEFAIELERLLAENPQLRSLTPAEQKAFFDLWYRQGDKLSLLESLQKNPDWQKIAWREMALAYRDYQDYRQAYETVAQFITRAEWPQTDEPIERLTARFKSGSGDKNLGLKLAAAQFNRGEVDGALVTLDNVSSQTRAPSAVYYFEAELFARKACWQKAWEAIWKYQSAMRPN
jgi:Flp pilus assembly protein TadD/O-antigen ligase